ncbi:LysR family transcriptional regulator [Amphritea japonica]|uniref:LysR family transcriptional regulator n=1 Tax=Amphritea japonica ATCC BAA-1530 TaxID=1278309 RepID=A0A7R6SSR2_9GAMM|nr:LysR family transcriptional regulator [Amphritea japonica]BBB25862.1 LysR family transcriptional regulator [Amphritea japonica ATCC BAA-1530]
MNLKQMEAFRAVMLTGSVSQAAKQLYRTQPAVSMMLSSLEEDIGFQLFERRKKRLYPTPEANYLYNEVAAIFSRIQDLSQTVQDIQNKQYGFLRIGCMPGPSNFFIPDILADYLEEHPNVQASLQTRTSDSVVEWIASNQYDLGLAEMSMHQLNGSRNQIFELLCTCAIPANHPLAEHSVITPAMLDEEPMITLHPDHMIFHDLLQLFEASGHRMNVCLQTRFFIPALKFVERGLGVCVLDPISAFSYTTYAQPGKVVFRRFQPDVHLRVGLMFPSDAPSSMITLEFAELLRNRIENVIENPERFLNWGQ